jgi:hypothetical protein
MTRQYRVKHQFRFLLAKSKFRLQLARSPFRVQFRLQLAKSPFRDQLAKSQFRLLLAKSKFRLQLARSPSRVQLATSGLIILLTKSQFSHGTTWSNMKVLITSRCQHALQLVGNLMTCCIGRFQPSLSQLMPAKKEHSKEVTEVIRGVTDLQHRR